MNSNDGQHSADSTFIILVPVKSKRKFKLFYVTLTGIILTLSALYYTPGTIGELLLKIICSLAGIFVVYYAYRDFKQPGSVGWFSTDTIITFSGFLIIAMGTFWFDPYNGFQVAHVFFAIGSLSIFRGVMFRESGFKAGFMVDESDVTFAGSIQSDIIKIQKSAIEDIYKRGTKIIFQLFDQPPVEIDVSGFEKTDIACSELNKEILKR